MKENGKSMFYFILKRLIEVYEKNRIERKERNKVFTIL